VRQSGRPQARDGNHGAVRYGTRLAHTRAEPRLFIPSANMHFALTVLCKSNNQSGLNGSFQDMLAAAGVDVDGLNLDGAAAFRSC